MLKPAMQAHRAESTVAGDGSVTVHGVPFLEGEEVEVIVLPRERRRTDADRDLLRGSVTGYDAPLEPATGSGDWDSTRGTA